MDLRFFIPTNYAPYAKARVRSISKINNYKITTDLKNADVIFAQHFKGPVTGTAELNKEEAEKLYKKTNHKKQYINWIQGIDCFDSKQCNYLVMKKLYELNNCNIHSSKLEIIPKQYDLTNEKQCEQFKNSSYDNNYLAKGADSQMGEDIFMLNQKEVDCSKKQIYIKNKKYSINNKKFQAQRFVTPLLLDGEVSTFRIYILILYTKNYGFICYYYHPGYAYSSGTKFKKGDYSIENILANKGVRRGWESDQIDEELRKQHKLKRGQSFMKPFGENSFSNKVKNILDVVMKGFVKKLKKESKTFSLLGCDILVDENLNCFWIDPNIGARFSPWAQPQWESAIKLVVATNVNLITPKLGKLNLIVQTPFKENNEYVTPTGEWMCVYIENQSGTSIICKDTKPSKKSRKITNSSRKKWKRSSTRKSKS